MDIGLIGKKIGMTREFLDSGNSVPVTVLSIEKGRILDVITKKERGYDAIQVGFGKIKVSKLTKQMKGFFAKKSTEPNGYNQQKIVWTSEAAGHPDLDKAMNLEVYRI